MKKYLAPTLSAIMAAGGIALIPQSTTGLILGVLLLIFALLLFVAWLLILKDPEGAAQKLLDRRAELERKVQGEPSQEQVAEPTPEPQPNRAARRAADRKKS